MCLIAPPIGRAAVDTIFGVFGMTQLGFKELGLLDQTASYQWCHQSGNGMECVQIGVTISQNMKSSFHVGHIGDATALELTVTKHFHSSSPDH